MIDINEQLDQIQKEYDDIIGSEADKYDNAINELKNELMGYHIDNFEEVFGDFFLRVMGNINSTTEKCNNNYEGAWSSWNKWADIPAIKLTVGKQFGVIGGKKIKSVKLSHADYIHLFNEEYVKLIKNDKKRAIANDFLKFSNAYRNNYNKIINSINEKTYNVSIPIRLYSKYVIDVNNGCKSISAVNDLKSGVINKIEFSIKPLTLNNKTARFRFDFTKYGHTRCYRKISINSKILTIKFTGFVEDNSEKPFVDYVTINFNDISKGLSDFVDNLTKADLAKYIRKLQEGGIDYTSNPYYFIHNKAHLLKLPFIDEPIKDFIKYYKQMAKTFEYIRMKYMKNVLINGLF